MAVTVQIQAVIPAKIGNRTCVLIIKAGLQLIADDQVLQFFTDRQQKAG